jgi:hypothetical protein
LEKLLGRAAQASPPRKAAGKEAPVQAPLFAEPEPPASPKPAARRASAQASGAVIGFEDKLWLAADKLRVRASWPASPPSRPSPPAP